MDVAVYEEERGWIRCMLVRERMGRIITNLSIRHGASERAA